MSAENSIDDGYGLAVLDREVFLFQGGGATGDCDADGDVNLPTPPPSPSRGQVASREEDLDSRRAAEELFTKVKCGLDTSHTVLCNLAVESFIRALMWIEIPAAQQFIHSCFHQVTTILLDQDIMKIGVYERCCVEQTLEQAVGILLWFLDCGDVNYLPTLYAIFNKKKLFYKGTERTLTESNGAPEVRMEKIKQFGNNGGFELLADVLEGRRGVSIGWQGAEHTKIMLKALADYLHNDPCVSSDDVASRLCNIIMEQIIALTEEELENEPAETVMLMVGDLRRIAVNIGGTAPDEVFPFWLKLTLKYIQSSSLRLRLEGWDRVNNIIEIAVEQRPQARAYKVEGAGCKIVNGMYENAGVGLTNAPQYQLKPTVSGVPLLTLFRCQMRTKGKWWFISEQDKKEPGTDKDIDYYHNKGNVEQDNEPPRTGWCTCQSGQDPPPVLTPIGLLVAEGKENDTLEHQLARWAMTNNVLDAVFGDRIHREVVRESVSLLKFLGQMPGYLKEGHIDMIWQAGVGKGELQGEVYSVLSALVEPLTEMSPDLGAYLIDKVNDAAEKNWGSGLPQEFVESIGSQDRPSAGGNESESDDEDVFLGKLKKNKKKKKKKSSKTADTQHIAAGLAPAQEEVSPSSPSKEMSSSRSIEETALDTNESLSSTLTYTPSKNPSNMQHKDESEPLPMDSIPYSTTPAWGLPLLRYLPPACPSPPPPPPPEPDWRTAIDFKSGKPYYYDKNTGEVSWHAPSATSTGSGVPVSQFAEMQGKVDVLLRKMDGMEAMLLQLQRQSHIGASQAGEGMVETSDVPQPETLEGEAPAAPAIENGTQEFKKKLRPCVHCGEMTHRRCAGCKVFFYCSQLCQKTGYAAHKKACLRIREDAGIEGADGSL